MTVGGKRVRLMVSMKGPEGRLGRRFVSFEAHPDGSVFQVTPTGLQPITDRQDPKGELRRKVLEARG